MSSSSHIKLVIRQPPHRDFTTGYPGLSLQDGAHLRGSVEVRIGSGLAQAQWLQIELRKTETLVAASKGIRRYYELIGVAPVILWNGTGHIGTTSDGFAPISDGNYPFSIPIPAGLPPSIVLDRAKGTGIVYHLCATLLVRPKHKRSIFSSAGDAQAKAAVPVVQTVECLIEKHELNPTWPIYAWQAEKENINMSRAGMTINLRRDAVICGCGDSLDMSVEIVNGRASQTRVSKVEAVLRETITTRETKQSSRPSTSDGQTDSTDASRGVTTQTNDVLVLKASSSRPLLPGESYSQALRGVIPATHYRFTLRNAKNMEIRYTLHIRAALEITKDKKSLARRLSLYSNNGKDSGTPAEEAIKELVLDDVPILISPWSKKLGDWWRHKVGNIPTHLDRQPEAAQAQQQPQPLPDNVTPAKRLANSPLEQSAATFAGFTRANAESPVQTLHLHSPAERQPLVPQRASSSIGNSAAVISGRSLRPSQPPPVPHATRPQSMAFSTSKPSESQLSLPETSNLLPLSMHMSRPISMTSPGNWPDYYGDDEGEELRRSPSLKMDGPYPSLHRQISPVSPVHSPRLSPVHDSPPRPTRTAPPIPGAHLADPAEVALPLSPIARSPSDAIQRRSRTLSNGLARKTTLSTIAASPLDSPADTGTATSPHSPLISDWLHPGTARAGDLAVHHEDVETPTGPLTREALMASESPSFKVEKSGDSRVPMVHPSPADAPQAYGLFMPNGNDTLPNSTAASFVTADELRAMSPPMTTPQSSVMTTASSLPACIDAQKFLYLQALAAREAYQRKLAGTEPEPLIAFEEKRRIASSDPGHDTVSHHSQQSTASNSRTDLGHTDVDERNPYYRNPVVDGLYLDPSGKYSHESSAKVQQMESAQSSSSNLPSASSHTSMTSGSSYMRDPAIAQGKQRLRQIITDIDNSAPIRPNRPPKPREIIMDTYAHLDSPKEMSAVEFEQRFFGRSISAIATN